MSHELERGLRFLGKLTARVPAKAIEQALLGLMAPFNGEHLKIMIDHGWYVIETLRWAATNPGRGYENVPELTPQEIRVLEARRQATLRVALATLGAAKQLTARLPSGLVRLYLTKEYARKWFTEKRPDLIQVIDAAGLVGEGWLQRQIEEIEDFFLAEGLGYG